LQQQQDLLCSPYDILSHKDEPGYVKLSLFAAAAVFLCSPYDSLSHKDDPGYVKLSLFAATAVLVV
jgi:hypothetical protein